MRVLCVQTISGIGIEVGTGKMRIVGGDAEIEIGQVYTVCDIIGNPATDYRLSEREWRYRYNVKYFAPLSNVDELQLTESSTTTP